MTAMQNISFQIGLLVLLAMGALGCGEQQKQQVNLAGREFHLELAVDDTTRTQGLMHRTELADDGGMLFVFRDMRLRGFWMKNCLIPIDAIFIDHKGYIVNIAQMQPPRPETVEAMIPSYSSVRPCQYVIEIRGGRARQIGLKLGQRIELPFESLKQRLQPVE